MGNVAVIGTQWGDEGKGKIVDWLSARADMVVRFQGGHNAGHTLVIDGKVYKLSLLPSGIVREGKLSLIGNGVVVDPWALIEEIERITAQGVAVSPKNLRVAENATLILPCHRELDNLNNKDLGTTKRGIGPAYEDKVARRALRVIDLTQLDELPQRLERLLFHHNALRRGLGAPEIDGDALIADLRAIAPKITPFLDRSWQLIDKATREGKRILFEGAQGVLLDIDHGTYPFVTSSNIVAAQAAVGSGAAVKSIHYVLGITKAYTTRVGEGPFPTEQDNAMGELIGQRGAEFGTVTGRKRRCGWFDAVLVRQAVRCGGVDGIALTKLDVLDGMDEIKLCVGYKLNGASIDYLPSSLSQMEAVEPVYETMEGWQEGSIKGARSWSALPAAAIKYVRYIEELIGVPVTLLSTSPEREDAITMVDPFNPR